MNPGAIFTLESADYLGRVYPDRIDRALPLLGDEHLWWRPHDQVLSAGVILRHLEGNIRQWILSGLGGLEDQRERAQEFTAEERPSAEELAAALRRAAEHAADLVHNLDPGDLSRERTIQGRRVSTLGAILHVVEHMSWHTGQLVWLAKARGGPAHGLAYYDESAINSARNPPE